MGRPARDFDGLFREFISTNLPRAEFLRQKNINPHSGSAIRNTSTWETHRLRQICDGELASFATSGLTAKEGVFSDIRALDPVKNRPDICASLSTRLMERIQSLLADSADSDLTVNDIAKLSDSLGQLQQIQRRSLGMSDVGSRAIVSTQEFGDTAVDTHTSTPVYSSEMTADGKFKTARPKLLQGAELEEFLSTIDPAVSEIAKIENHDPGVPRFEVYFWDSKVQRNIRQFPKKRA